MTRTSNTVVKHLQFRSAKYIIAGRTKKNFHLCVGDLETCLSTSPAHAQMRIPAIRTHSHALSVAVFVLLIA